MADSEKLSEEVRKYPVLYDKSCKEFKEKAKKQAAWAAVAAASGVSSGDEACRLFTNLRNRYGRDKKRIESAKVSGSGAKDVDDAMRETSDMYKYLSWLDAYVKPRKTTTNFSRLSNSMSEGSYVSGESSEEDIESESGLSTVDSLSEVNEQQILTQEKNANVQRPIRSKIGRGPSSKKKRTTSEEDDKELVLLADLGATLKQQMTAQNKGKDDDDLFSEYLVSQLKLLPLNDKLHAKHKINTIIYEAIMRSSSEAVQNVVHENPVASSLTYNYYNQPRTWEVPVAHGTPTENQRGFLPWPSRLSDPHSADSLRMRMEDK